MLTSLSDILHVVSQALLVPDIILLLLLIGYALFSIGSILVELFTEHRYYKVVMPKFLAALTDADEGDVPAVIDGSGLLKRQKSALKTVHEYRALPGDALIALVKRLMSEEEAHYDHIVDRNNMASRVAPMLGLMGTLIPLGPGIQALGNADTAALSSSLLVAFDTTVAGLVTAAVCLVIGKVRTTWYNDYMSALDSAMATMIQKIEDTRGQDVALPSDDEPETGDASDETGVVSGDNLETPGDDQDLASAGLAGATASSVAAVTAESQMDVRPLTADPSLLEEFAQQESAPFATGSEAADVAQVGSREDGESEVEEPSDAPVATADPSLGTGVFVANPDATVSLPDAFASSQSLESGFDQRVESETKAPATIDLLFGPMAGSARDDAPSDN